MIYFPDQIQATEGKSWDGRNVFLGRKIHDVVGGKCMYLHAHINVVSQSGISLDTKILQQRRLETELSLYVAKKKREGRSADICEPTVFFATVNQLSIINPHSTISREISPYTS